MSDERDDQPAADHGEEPWDGPLLGDDAEGHPGGEEPREAGPRPRRRRSFASCLLVLIVLAAIGGAAVLGVTVGLDKVKEMLAGPADYSGDGSGSVLVFEVKTGESSAAIGHNLLANGVVRSVAAYTEAAADEPASLGIQVGFYEMNEEMSADSALEVLIDPHNLIRSQVTVPEGLRVPDTLRVLAKGTKLPLKDFKRALKKPDSIGLPSYAKGNAEGYLFPATYVVPPNAEAKDVLSSMVARWQQAADDADLEGAAEELGYSPAELMTIASLVESEANRQQDRGKVARVIYNRLETDATNGLLQIDATVNFALGRDLGLGLSSEDLAVDSPYNTRKLPGLPPGPIESPGDAAIEAATNPTEGSWVYYVTVNLDTGETKFTKSYQEFLKFKNQDLAAYCETSDRC